MASTKKRKNKRAKGGGFKRKPGPKKRRKKTPKPPSLRLPKNIGELTRLDVKFMMAVKEAEGCSIPVSLFAQMCGCDPRNIRISITRLVNNGWIKCDPESRTPGHTRTVQYEILKPLEEYLFEHLGERITPSSERLLF